MTLLLALLACATPATPENFAASYADSVCTWLEACSDLEWSYEDCFEQTEAASAGHVNGGDCPAWDADAAAACIATYEDAAPACGTPDASLCTTLPCE